MRTCECIGRPYREKLTTFSLNGLGIEGKEQTPHLPFCGWAQEMREVDRDCVSQGVCHRSVQKAAPFSRGKDTRPVSQPPRRSRGLCLIKKTLPQGPRASHDHESQAALELMLGKRSQATKLTCLSRKLQKFPTAQGCVWAPPGPGRVGLWQGSRVGYTDAFWPT